MPAVHETEDDFCLLSEFDLRELASGISSVLRCYEGLGCLSFNYALYSAGKDRRISGSRCFFRIISRQNLYPNCRNYDYFLQKLLQSELIIMPPEELARIVKAFF